MVFFGVGQSENICLALKQKVGEKSASNEEVSKILNVPNIFCKLA